MIVASTASSHKAISFDLFKMPHFLYFPIHHSSQIRFISTTGLRFACIQHWLVGCHSILYSVLANHKFSGATREIHVKITAGWNILINKVNKVIIQTSIEMKLGASVS